MQRVFRFTLAGALAIAGLTACGSSKENTQPLVPTAVTVTPASANMNVGDKLLFVATVTADPSVTNRAVTWTSSNPAVATVDANGNVTAVAGGTTSIVASAAAAPTVQGAAVVTVGAVVQPTVTISSINHTVAGTGSVPVDQSNVSGQVDVLVNVDPGTQKVSTVSLIATVNGKDTVVQTATVASQSVAPGASDASSIVTLSFNTAAFNAATGVVAFKNGPIGIKASAVTSGGTIVASSSQTLTLNNTDFVSLAAGAVTTTPSAGQSAAASDPSGLLWRAGSVTVTAVPVVYTPGRSVVSGSIALVNGTAASPTQLGQNKTPVAGGVAFATLTNISDSTGSMSATFPNSTTATGGVGGATVNGVTVTVQTVDNLGNQGPSTVQNATNVLRLDNLAPDVTTTPPTFVANTQNSQNGWVGKNFVFSVAAGSLTLGSAAQDVFGGVAGVAGVIDTTQFSVGGGSFTPFGAVTSLAETSSGSTNTLRLRVCDALGNCANTAALGTFGVDLTPPSLGIISAPNNKQVFNIGQTVTATSFSVTDTSNTPGVTASGAATNDLLVSLQGLTPSGGSGSQTVCTIGTATGSAPAVTCKAPIPEPGAFSLGTGATAAGEYTLNVQAVDQAGNTSAVTTILYYLDQASPVVAGGVAVPASIATGATFTSTATDNMDVAAGNGNLQYTGIGVIFTEGGTATPAGVVFDNALTRSSSIVVTLNPFYRSLSNTIGTAGEKPEIAGIRAVDAANNLAINQPVALPASNIANGTTFSATDPSIGITAWSVAAAPNPVDSLKTTTLTASATAFSTTSASPFTNVCFYQVSASGTEGGAAGPGGSATGELVLIGCSSAETTTIVGANRLLTYSVPFTAPVITGGGIVRIFAIGNNAGTDGLMTAPVNLTVNP